MSSRKPISSGLTSFPPHLIKPDIEDISSLQPLTGSGTAAAETAATLERAISGSQDFLLTQQLPEGYWWAELESNVTITAEYLLLFHLLGAVDRERERKIVNYLLSKQTDEGFWCIYFGGPGDISTTVEAYFALKLAGTPAQHPQMVKARAFILEKGGLLKCRVFTKIFLALFGQFAWLGIPSMPIELMLLPNWAYFNMYELSSWSRATIIPLSVVMDKRPVKALPADCSVSELYLRPPKITDYTFTKEDGLFTWKNFFIGVDHLLKIYENGPLRPLRSKGTAVAEQWVLDHQEPSGDWGGIQPAMLNSILALHCLGYGNGHPKVSKGLEALANFAIETADTLVLQSCISPVWDTALAIKALVDSGLPPAHPALTKGAQWLLEQEIVKRGDWQVKAPELSPGGWAFEFQNDWYPDVDDTGYVLLALRDIQLADSVLHNAAIERGIAWCLGMQSKNGGWGAFDRDNTKHLLNKIPFADLEALIDPPTADLTGRMLELMGNFGYDRSHPAAGRALAFIRKEQDKNGSWWGRWGVNHIYGTWSVLGGLAAINEEMSQPYIQKALTWLKEKQNNDGGWGESCASYHDPGLAGIGTSTPSQTGWALLALMTTGDTPSTAVKRGIDYLLATQKRDGSWDEEQFTGTGFPKYFMIRYHIYRNCFPLAALGTYRRLCRPEKQNI